MSYTRLGTGAPSGGPGVAIRSTSNYAGETVEAFNAGDQSSDFPNLQKGVEFNSRPINLDMHRRYCWLAACAPKEDIDTSWFFVGRFVFWLGAQIMLQIPIQVGGTTAPGYGDVGRRYNGGGGLQPPITFKYLNDTYSKDVPCLTFTVRANRIALIPEALALPWTGNVYVFGFQIISQNETI